MCASSCLPRRLKPSICLSPSRTTSETSSFWTGWCRTWWVGSLVHILHSALLRLWPCGRGLHGNCFTVTYVRVGCCLSDALCERPHGNSEGGGCPNTHPLPRDDSQACQEVRTADTCSSKHASLLSPSLFTSTPLPSPRPISFPHSDVNLFQDYILPGLVSTCHMVIT